MTQMVEIYFSISSIQYVPRVVRQTANSAEMQNQMKIFSVKVVTLKPIQIAFYSSFSIKPMIIENCYNFSTY